ncbi:MAG: low molecular weight phosphatase family protein [Phycisphaerae bacterium]
MVDAYLEAREAEFSQINEERKSQLEQVSTLLRTKLKSGRPFSLTFVCTHNSRRSHMAQLWAAAAAARYDLPIHTFSGGTEATAFHPNAIGAMRRAGMQVEKTNDISNPIYHVRFATGFPAQTCFSKKFDTSPNPTDAYAAIMVCTDADKRCPLVHGADGRFAIPYVDPKISDGTAMAEATYDERAAQIAREMLYMMSKAAR